MISRLWLTLTHFFNYKPDMNVKFLGDGATQKLGEHVVIVHRASSVKDRTDTFLFDILIPQLMALNVSFEVVGLAPLFSRAEFRVIDILEVLLMVLGLEKWRPSYLEVSGRLQKTQVSHVIFNNVLPTVSLALPEHFKKRNVKTFFWIHNARLQCANGLNFNGRKECHRCLTRGSRWAFMQKCLPTWRRSLLYSWLYRGRRTVQRIAPFIDSFIAASDFSAKNVIESCAATENTTPSISVIRYAFPHTPLATNDRASTGAHTLMDLTKKIPHPFYAYVGSLSFEKGADRMIELAERFSKRGFVICGDGPLFDKIKNKSPSNLVMAGFIGAEAKEWIYKTAAAIIVPSRNPDPSSLVMTESQIYATPIVYVPGGGAEEIFHFYNRSGCALNEFNGQVFKKTEPIHDEGNSFGDSLKSVLKIGYGHE